MPFDIFLLVLIYSLHVLNHLVIARRYHVTILVLHHIVCVLRTETLHLFALSSGGALLLLEKCHVKTFCILENNCRKKILHSNVQLQHVFSSHCGYFCVSFILCLENNIPFHKFLKMFHKKDLYLNDYISIKIITSFIEYMYLRN